MSEDNRRRHRRLKLRWGVACSEDSEVVETADMTQSLSWTRNISVDGMYFVMPPADAPKKGSMLAFKLAVPPGEGYSTSECMLLGSGEVVRQVKREGDMVGLAVQFADKPTIMP